MMMAIKKNLHASSVDVVREGISVRFSLVHFYQWIWFQLWYLANTTFELLTTWSVLFIWPLIGVDVFFSTLLLFHFWQLNYQLNSSASGRRVAPNSSEVTHHEWTLNKRMAENLVRRVCCTCTLCCGYRFHYVEILSVIMFLFFIHRWTKMFCVNFLVFTFPTQVLPAYKW